MRKNGLLHIFLFFILFFHFDFACSQNIPSGKSYSFHFNQVTLKKALDTLEKEADLSFSYNPSKLPLNTVINLDVTEKTWEIILQQICEQVEIEYNILEKQIILKPRKAEKDFSENAMITLSGYIKDKDTEEVLIGASLYIRDRHIGTISNAYGFFSLSIPHGNQLIEVSYLGYENYTETKDFATNEQMTIYLKPSNRILQELIVSSMDAPFTASVAQMSSMNIKSSDISDMPAFMGEADVIKSMQAIPGISLFGDGSTMFFVRGGDRDQNILLLDEAPIYNPSHMLGLFSTFMPDAIKNITIYKGDIPASYGGRLSSLIDIRTNDGNMNQFGLNGSVGLLSSKLAIQTPLKKQKSSIFISGRRSHIKWLFQQFNPNVNSFHFYDFNTKLNFIGSEKNRFFITYYTGADAYSQQSPGFSASGIKWKNNAITFRWNHLFNKKLFANSTIYASNYDYALNTSIENDNYWKSSIGNLTAKTDFSWFINNNNTLYTGIQFSGHNLNPGNFYLNGNLTTAYPYVSKKHTREITIYAENEQKIGNKINLRYGFRLTSWENTGESFEYVYNENMAPVDSIYYGPGVAYHQFGNIEPRLSVSYQPAPGFAIKGSYNRTAQYLHLISNSISPFTTLDVWLPSGPNIPDQKANQVALGLFYQWKETGINFSSEVYYKKLKNQIDYINHAEMLLNPTVETELRFGDGKAYGIEFLIKKNQGRLNGWVGYTLSKALRQTNGINGGREYPAFYDRPHEITFYMGYDFSTRLSASINWYYSTGAAITTPSGFYELNGTMVPLYTEKNNDRFPDYHRMDLGILYRLNKNSHRFEHQLGFTIYNLYGRRNPVFVNFNKIESDENNFLIPADISAKQPLVNSHIFIYNVVPSLTYYFKFR